MDSPSWQNGGIDRRSFQRQILLQSVSAPASGIIGTTDIEAVDFAIRLVVLYAQRSGNRRLDAAVLAASRERMVLGLLVASAKTGIDSLAVTHFRGTG